MFIVKLNKLVILQLRLFQADKLNKVVKLNIYFVFSLKKPLISYSDCYHRLRSGADAEQDKQLVYIGNQLLDFGSQFVTISTKNTYSDC